MLPQFGMMEFMLVAIIALIVVGPRDLPLMMRKFGQFVAKGRAMAREFQSAFDDIAKQAELDELRQEIESLKRENAVAEAAADLKAVESDINTRVMRDHPKHSGTETDTSDSEAESDKVPLEQREQLPSETPQPSNPDAEAISDATSEQPADETGKDRTGA